MLLMKVDIFHGMILQQKFFKQAEYTTEVLPVTTEEHGLSKAARPFNSRLDKSKADI